MTFEADFKSHLQSDGTISGTVNDRIYPSVMPQSSTLPAITYSFVSGNPQTSIDGFTSGVSRYGIQIDCWASSYSSVIALALAVRNRLKTNAATFSIVITEYPLFDDYEPDTKLYRRSIGCACWFKE